MDFRVDVGIVCIGQVQNVVESTRIPCQVLLLSLSSSCYDSSYNIRLKVT